MPTPPESRWPRRMARPHDCARAISSGAQLREPVGQLVAAEAGRQRLGHHHPPGGVDPDPIAVERHLDAAIGAKVGRGLPRDVGQQARGMADAAHRRRIVEHRPIQASRMSPCSPNRRSAPPASRAASISGSAPALGFEVRVEQPLANAEAGQDELARLELVGQRRGSSPPPATSRGAPGRRPSTSSDRASRPFLRSSRARSAASHIGASPGSG